LGGEPLRDIIAYMQSVDGGKYRTVDLRDAFTASTGGGIYDKVANKGGSLDFAKTGTVKIGDIPFNIVPPEKSPLNVIVLKGGPADAYSKTLPQKVEASLGGFKANRLNILGGVTGWGYRGPGTDTSDVLKITAVFADGQKETIVCKNGTEFVDYNSNTSVPGSKLAEGIVREHQIRWFSMPLSRTGPIEKLVFESFDAMAAPTIVAVTAELAEPNAEKPKPAATGTTNAASSSAAAAEPKDEDAGFKPQFNDPVPQPPAERPAKGPRVLLVGGGSSHDFVKFFGESDKSILADVAGWVDFTQNANGVPEILDRVDVLVWSANQPISSKTRKALIEFANSGKGIIPFHPGTWYAWNNFPQWNQEVIGGGTRGHDALGPFEVTVTEPENPIVAGVTPKFEIIDELYNYKADPAGTPIEVLATAKSPKSGKEFPQVFIVKHPKCRIVGITLGHDARAHDLPEFQKILKQAVKWAGEK
ncbi:MAG: ThuA domain-containing protein, partial [Chthoniobacteraceae bacterium]